MKPTIKHDLEQLRQMGYIKYKERWPQIEIEFVWLHKKIYVYGTYLEKFLQGIRLGIDMERAMKNSKPSKQLTINNALSEAIKIQIDKEEE